MQDTSEKELEKSAARELEGKNIAYYSVLLAAWIQTKMERDKTLVTLSAAAIGLLITILTTVGVRSVWEILLYVVAIISFLITIWSSLIIYQLNSKHLEDALSGSSESDPRLEKYDKRSIVAFITGAISALLIGVLSASYQLTKSEENAMVEKSNDTKNTGKQTTFRESVNGVTKLNPGTTLKKSVAGVGNLKPKAPVTAPDNGGQTQDQSGSSSQGDSGGKTSEKGDK